MKRKTSKPTVDQAITAYQRFLDLAEGCLADYRGAVNEADALIRWEVDADKVNNALRFVEDAKLSLIISMRALFDGKQDDLEI